MAKTRGTPSRCEKAGVRCTAKRGALQSSCDRQAFQRYEPHVLPQAGLDSLPCELLALLFVPIGDSDLGRLRRCCRALRDAVGKFAQEHGRMQVLVNAFGREHRVIVRQLMFRVDGNGDGEGAAPGARQPWRHGHNTRCEVCDAGGSLLCCDFCNLVYHGACLEPPLTVPPDGGWTCPECHREECERLSATGTARAPIQGAAAIFSLAPCLPSASRTHRLLILAEFEHLTCSPSRATLRFEPSTGRAVLHRSVGEPPPTLCPPALQFEQYDDCNSFYGRLLCLAPRKIAEDRDDDRNGNLESGGGDVSLVAAQRLDTDDVSSSDSDSDFDSGGGGGGGGGRSSGSSSSSSSSSSSGGGGSYGSSNMGCSGSNASSSAGCRRSSRFNSSCGANISSGSLSRQLLDITTQAALGCPYGHFKDTIDDVQGKTASMTSRQQIDWLLQRHQRRQERRRRRRAQLRHEQQCRQRMKRRSAARAAAQAALLRSNHHPFGTLYSLHVRNDASNHQSGVYEGADEWTAEPLTGDIPIPSIGYATALWKRHQHTQMLIWGGIVPRQSSSVSVVAACELHLLCLATRRWTRAQFASPSAPPPCARTSHTLTRIGPGLFVIFGGLAVSRQQRNAYLGDIYALEVCKAMPAAPSSAGSAPQSQWRWSQPKVRGSLPAPRAGHAAVAVGAALVITCGTTARSVLDARGVYVLSTITWTWSEVVASVPSQYMPPPGRIAPGLCFGDGVAAEHDTLWLFGGVQSSHCHNANEFLADCYELRPDTLTDERMDKNARVRGKPGRCWSGSPRGRQGDRRTDVCSQTQNVGGVAVDGGCSSSSGGSDSGGGGGRAGGSDIADTTEPQWHALTERQQIAALLKLSKLEARNDVKS